MGNLPRASYAPCMALAAVPSDNLTSNTTTLEFSREVIDWSMAAGLA